MKNALTAIIQKNGGTRNYVLTFLREASALELVALATNSI